MPTINPEKCVALLYKLHTLSLTAWDLSKNDELTSILGEAKDLLESMINTIETAYSMEES